MLRIERKPRKIGLNINNPEIKGTASINKYPDGEKGLDSANIYWLKKALNRMLKVVLDTAKKLSRKLSPTQKGNHRSTWWV